jgi:hypothetical protein
MPKRINVEVDINDMELLAAHDYAALLRSRGLDTSKPMQQWQHPGRGFNTIFSGTALPVAEPCCVWPTNIVMRVH